jgi:hypothetical protein
MAILERGQPPACIRPEGCLLSEHVFWSERRS